MIIRLDALNDNGEILEEVVIDLGEVLLFRWHLVLNETLHEVTFHFVNKAEYRCLVTKDVYETLNGCFESAHP